MPHPPPRPDNEPDRLAALRSLAVLDTSPDPWFDRIARFAATLLDAPMAFISLVDEDRQWCKARFGVEVAEIARDLSVCAHAILSDAPLVVADTTQDERFADNPLVTGGPRIRFYAGAPIITRDGYALGSMCVADTAPRDGLCDKSRDGLVTLAGIVADQIELRAAAHHALADAIARQEEHERQIDYDQQFIKAVLDNVREGILTCDADGQLSLFNKAAVRMHGKGLHPCGPDEWAQTYGLYEGDGVTPMTKERIPLYRALMGETVTNGEFVVALDDGATNVHICQAAPLLSKRGERLGAIVLSHDATEEYRDKEALKRNQAELELIFNSVPTMLLHKDDNNRIVRANQAAARVLGYSVDALRGVHLSEICVAHAEQYHADDLETLRSGRPRLGVVEEYALANGRRGWLRTDKVPYYDPQTKERFVFVACHDITAEREAESALLASEQRYRDLYHRTPTMLLSVDRKTRIVGVSDLWLAVTGYTREEVVGRPAGEFFTPESVERLAKTPWRQFLQDGYCQNEELQCETKEGRRLDMLLSAIAEFDETGALTGAMAVLTDVTEQREIERQLSQAQKMESVGQLTGGLAHDFNNLLGVIIGNLQMVTRTLKDDDKSIKRINAARTAAQRGAELTRRLLAFSRKQSLDTECFAPNPLINDMIEIVDRTIGGAIELSTALTDTLPNVRTDPAQLESALLNLAVNARDAMPQGGSLTITSEASWIDEELAKQHPDVAPGDYVCISVADTGVGIPKDDLEKVFEPFFTTKDVGKGSGLGLSMVYGLMKQSNGHVRIDSKVGRGTTVRLYFPAQTPSATNASTSKSDPDAAPMGAGELVLVVEDQHELLDVAVAMLHDLGYQTVEASCGATALAEIKANPRINLVFTDIMMPGGMDGVQLADAVKTLRPGLPVLFTSGYAEEDRLIAGGVSRAENLLPKPYERTQLALKVRAMLDAGNRPSSTQPQPSPRHNSSP